MSQVSKSAASAMGLLAAIGAGITMLNGVVRFESLRVATGEIGAASNSRAFLLLDTRHYGVLVAQVIFGLWLIAESAEPAAGRPESGAGADDRGHRHSQDARGPCRA